MDALGHLTGGIAHDFNNMLMVVGGYAEFLKRRLSDPKDRRALDAIELATSRAESLTRQLLTFSRRQSLNPATVNLAERFAAFRDILASSAHGNIQLDIDVAPDTWPVTIDPNEFEVAIVNLVVNARDAMPDGGGIAITVRNVAIGAHDPIDGLEGEFVVVEVKDTGVGIPPDVLPRVFDPFFTTKETDRGTGLGLSQVYGFARRRAGPRGFPACSARERPLRCICRAAGPSSRLAAPPSATARRAAAAMLDQLGYRVVEAGRADRAAQILGSGDPIDLVLSDIVMPGAMDGLAFAKYVRERYPRLPVLLTTGYSKLASGPHPGFAILRKPYQLSALAQAIRAALAGHPAAPAPASEQRGSTA